MSQYGAYGAARKGLTWKQILAFYYRGTKLTKMAGGTTIRVRISADRDGSLRVRPARGLTVRDGSGHSFKVPTGSRYRSWRIIRSGSGYKLSYRNANGNNVNVATKLSHQHLEVLQLGQDRQAGAAQRLRPALPRLAAAGEERAQRPDRQPGQAGRLRQGRGARTRCRPPGPPTPSGPRPSPPGRTGCGSGPTPATPATTSATPRPARSTAGSTPRPATGTPPSGPRRG